MYLLSVVIGTIVGAILLGILRKPVEEKQNKYIKKRKSKRFSAFSIYFHIP